jgi:hypothetical protein
VRYRRRVLTLALTLALASGGPAWSTSVKLEPGGKKTFHATGVKRGEWYELVTRGTCVRQERKRYREWRKSISGGTEPQVMGVDFKVTVGGLERISVDHQERTTAFKADRDDPDVTIEDQSTPQAGVRCVVTDLVIRRPPASGG